MPNFEFTESIVSDLRDSGGHTFKVVRLTGISGSYSTGGTPVEPSDFEFEQILFLSAQPSYAVLLQENDLWQLFIFITVMEFVDENGDSAFKILIFRLEDNGSYVELPDGTPMSLNPSTPISLLMVGS